jgi:hypothetical protein
MLLAVLVGAGNLVCCGCLVYLVVAVLMECLVVDRSTGQTKIL